MSIESRLIEADSYKSANFNCSKDSSTAESWLGNIEVQSFFKYSKIPMLAQDSLLVRLSNAKIIDLK